MSWRKAPAEAGAAAGKTVVGELLGHKDGSPGMIYTHVLNRGAKAVRSPLGWPGG